MTKKSIEAELNLSGGCLLLDGYKLEGTGGGCTALVKQEGGIEVLLTDGNLTHPDRFPLEASIFKADTEWSEFIDTETVSSEEELNEYIKGFING